MEILPVMIIGGSILTIFISIILVFCVDINIIRSKFSSKSMPKSKSKKDLELKSKFSSNAKAKIKKKEPKSTSKTKSKSTSNAKTESKNKSTTKSKLTPTTATTKPESQLESRQKIPWIFIILHIFSIVFSIALIATVFFISYERAEEEKMDTINNATNTILEAAKLKLDDISLEKLNKTIDDISLKLGYVVQTFQQSIGLVKITNSDGQYMNAFIETSSRLGEFGNSIKKLNNLFPAGCGAKIDLDADLVTRLERVNTDRKNVRIANLAVRIEEMDSKLTKIVEDQEKLDVGVSKIENHLIAMRSLLDHFRSDIKHSGNMTQQYSQEVLKLANQPDIPADSKWLVSITCSVLIVCSIISILCLSKLKFLDKRWSLFAACISIHFVGITAFISTIIIIRMSLRSMSEFDCLLNRGDFGLWNFTSPFSHSTIQNVSICATSDSNFYSALDNDLFSSFLNVSELFLIQEYKGRMLAAVNSSKISIEIPSSFLQEVKLIEDGVNKLGVLVGKKCLDDYKQKELENYHTLLKGFLVETGAYTNTIDEFNKKNVNTDTVLGPLLDSKYADIVKSIETSMSTLKQKITSSDFSCNPIFTSYTKTGQSICKILEISFDRCYIVMILAIIFFLFSLVLHTFVLKKLASENKNVEPVSKAFLPESKKYVKIDGMSSYADELDAEGGSFNEKNEEKKFKYSPELILKHRQYVQYMKNREKSDADSRKFRKQPPIFIPAFVGDEQFAKKCNDPDNIILDNVAYNPDDNELYEIGSDVDNIEMNPSSILTLTEESRKASTIKTLKSAKTQVTSATQMETAQQMKSVANEKCSRKSARKPKSAQQQPEEPAKSLVEAKSSKKSKK